jgi:hypothetical protein
MPALTEVEADGELPGEKELLQPSDEVDKPVVENLSVQTDELADLIAVPKVVDESTDDPAELGPRETEATEVAEGTELAAVSIGVADKSAEDGVTEDPLAAEDTTEDSQEAAREPAAPDEVAQSVGVALSGTQGPEGPQGPPGIPGPPGPAGAASIEGSVGFLTKFIAPTVGASSQIFDDGNNIGIGTKEPKQRLEVNGNIQIHERNSSVAGLMITQSDGDTGYIMHNRASTLTIGAGSVDRITIDRNGNVGFGVSRPSNPIEMASGAHVTAGGVWTNSSSRARKENIVELSLDDAVATLNRLEPVKFNYKNDRSEQYVGFIAEDVPDLVATKDRDGLSSMDIVAVLTRVVQEQQKKIEALEARLNQR